MTKCPSAANYLKRGESEGAVYIYNRSCCRPKNVGPHPQRYAGSFPNQLELRREGMKVSFHFYVDGKLVHEWPNHVTLGLNETFTIEETDLEEIAPYQSKKEVLSSFTHKSLMQLLNKYGFEYVTHEYYNDFGITVTDDLLILAKCTGSKNEPREFFESPRTVARYINLWNPIRSFVFGPIYSTWYKKLADFLRIPQLKLAARDPEAFLPLIKDRLKRNLGLS